MGETVEIRPFYDTATCTLTYLIWDAGTKDALLIDPVLDYDQTDGSISDDSARHVQDEIKNEGLRLHWVLETHAHADHLTAAQKFKAWNPQAKVGISERIREVQATFGDKFGLGKEFRRDGSQFDTLFTDGQKVQAGALNFVVLSTPGHTPACSSYYFEKERTLFSGDAVFMPDLGTGRCDFPGASAEQLFRSITRKIYSLPKETRVCPGHDYPPSSRELRWNCPVAEQLENNLHLQETTTKSEYVSFRTGRDATLTPPKLLYPSLFLNIRAGQLPEAQGDKMLLTVPPLV
jgi:glyoxylase-like metal-dependent hydrolase (beta-lactamase superfamily II)